MNKAQDNRELQSTDVVVIGSGIAGLFLALRCFREGLNVTIVTKKAISTSSTNWAQGGIAGVIDIGDAKALESHVQDTLASGGGICDEEVVRSVVNEAADRISDLVNHGVQFDKISDGDYHLAREGGHSDSRILHSRDRTGAEIERALVENASLESETGLRILENWMVLDLIMNSHSDPSLGITGIWAMAPNGTVYTLAAGAVVLATGGAGMLHLATTNPSVATGDGVAMAHRAGAEISDMEFIQFHPTALAVDSDTPFLITEAMRGFGAVLMTKSEHAEWRSKGGEADDFSYMSGYSDKGSLDTRDVVARATHSELMASNEDCVLLVTEHLDPAELREAFPTICARLSEHGIALGPDPIPVRPASHYLVGGVKVDKFGRAMVNGESMPGLFAIGEVACTGLHGANRLASNSLLEAVVYSERAAKKVIEDNVDQGGHEIANLPNWRDDDLEPFNEYEPMKDNLLQLRRIMTDNVGLVKSDKTLNDALAELEILRRRVLPVWHTTKPSQAMVELRNLLICAELVIRSSLNRRENVGLHYNIDLE